MSRKRAKAKLLRAVAHEECSERRRPPFSDVDATFGDLVARIGGKRGSDMVKDKSCLPRNADFWFPEHQVAIEVKSLAGEYEFATFFKNFVDFEVDGRGYIDALFDRLVNGTEIPERLAAKFETRFSRYLEKIVSKGVRQLEATASKKSGSEVLGAWTGRYSVIFWKYGLKLPGQRRDRMFLGTVLQRRCGP